MICYSCCRVSQAVRCPFCGGATEMAGNIRVGLDLPNPFSYAYNLGRDLGDRAVAPSQPSTEDTGPSLWDRLPNPFSKAYDLGYKGGDVVQETVDDLRSPLDAVTSLMTVVKYVVIAGAVVAIVVVGYGVIKFIPVALGIAAKQAEVGIKGIGTVVTKM